MEAASGEALGKARGQTPGKSGGPAPTLGVGHTLVRLVGFARPYIPILALALLCSTAYAGARALRAYLIKPLLDEVALPAYGAEVTSERDWISGLIPGLGAADPTPSPEAPLPSEQEAQERVGAEVRASFWNVMLAAGVVILLIPFAHFGSVYLVAWGMGRVLVDIQHALCQKLLVLPLSFHHQMTRGERLARTTSDAALSHSVLNLLFGAVAQDTLALAAGTAVLFTISWQLTLVTLLAAPLVAGVIVLFGGRIRRSAGRRQESVGDVTQRLVEILSGIKVIKAFRAHESESDAFQRENLRLWMLSQGASLRPPLTPADFLPPPEKPR